MIYYSVLIFLFLSGIVEILTDNKVKTALMAVTFLVFVVLAGLKFEVGTDYSSYSRIFDLARWYPFNPQFGVELLYWYWMRLFIYAGIGFLAFWFVTACINIGMKFYIFNKLSPYFFASMMMYFVGLFFERDFDGIRQGIGIGICYLGIGPLLNRQYWLYYLLVLIGYNFHTTCIVFALLPILQFVNLSLNTILVTLGIGFTLILAKVDLTEILMTMVPESFMKARLETYMSEGDELFTKSTGISMGIIFRVAIFGLFSYFGDRMIEDKHLFNIYRNGFFVAILFSLLFNNIDIVGHRLAYGLREFQIFMIPSFILLPKDKRWKLVLLTLIFLYSLFLLTRLLNTAHLAPYYYYKNIIHLLFNGMLN